MAAPARDRAQPLVRPQPARRPARRRPPARPRSQARTRPRLAGGVLWITVVGALLAGIVALNVAVLRLNMEVDRLERRQVELVARGDSLSSQLATAGAAGRVESLATGRLGLVAPDSTTYLTLRRKK